jgi:hypothetical protein
MTEVTPGRYRDYDDHTVECLHCTADSNGTVALIPGTAIEAHELWHAGPAVRKLLTPVTGEWPDLTADSDGPERDASEAYGYPPGTVFIGTPGETETRIPELTDDQLTAWAEEAWPLAGHPASEHDAWVEAYLKVGRMLSGKVIRG